MEEGTARTAGRMNSRKSDSETPESLLNIHLCARRSGWDCIAFPNSHIRRFAQMRRLDRDRTLTRIAKEYGDDQRHRGQCRRHQAVCEETIQWKVLRFALRPDGAISDKAL
jgi:hypothetical protein